MEIFFQGILHVNEKGEPVPPLMGVENETAFWWGGGVGRDI